MKSIAVTAVNAATLLIALIGAASAQPYGYGRGYGYPPPPPQPVYVTPYQAPIVRPIPMPNPYGEVRDDLPYSGKPNCSLPYGC
jgi:hypothetical protein